MLRFLLLLALTAPLWAQPAEGPPPRSFMNLSADRYWLETRRAASDKKPVSEEGIQLLTDENEIREAVGMGEFVGYIKAAQGVVREFAQSHHVSTNLAVQMEMRSGGRSFVTLRAEPALPAPAAHLLQTRLLAVKVPEMKGTVAFQLFAHLWGGRAADE